MKGLFKKLYSNSFFIYILASIAINFIIEIFSRNSFLDVFNYLFKSPLVFLYNSLLIFLTLSFTYIFKRRRFAFTIISTIWLSLGIANGIILSCRVTPFTAIDLTLITTGIKTASSYLSIFQMILLGFGIAALIGFLIFIYIKSPKFKGTINYKKNIPGIIILTLFVTFTSNILIKTNILSDYFSNIAFAYLDYGFPYCFSNTLLNTGIKKPANYSKETIYDILKSEIASKEPITLVSNDNKLITNNEMSKPNIIMIQLESFFDPTLVKNLKFSKDPIPNFRSIKDKFPSGYLTVPTVGAGTANTEFEVLTGMSLDFFGPGEYPYKTILKDTTCESINYTLKNLNYKTHAIHNNEGTFYDRDFIFSQLGFDTFTSLEYMDKLDFTPTGWSKDYLLTDEIIKTLNSTDGKDFIYTITVESHGSYYTDSIIENPEISVEGLEDEEEQSAFTYYVNLLHEVDKFINDLTTKLSALDEEVVLVMFGDHLPTLEITDESLKNNSIFETEYVVWNNINIPKTNENLQSYQLTSSILNRLNIHEGILNKFHSKAIKTDNYQNNLELLQYDMLYGKRYLFDGINPFIATDLKMGINTISISDVYVENGKVFVKGTNFTPRSRVYINNDGYDTTFISSNLLSIDEVVLEINDCVIVSQVNPNNTVLGSTIEYIIK